MNAETNTNPFAQMFASIANIAPFQLPSLADQGGKLRVMCDELTRAQANAATQTRAAIDDGARLMRSTVDYHSQLQAEWCKSSVEATQRMLALLTPPTNP